MRSVLGEDPAGILQVAHAVLPRLAREGPVPVARGFVGNPQHLLAVAEFIDHME